MIEQRSFGTEAADAEQRTLTAAAPNGRRPLVVDVSRPAADADTDSSSPAGLAVRVEPAERRIVLRGELDIASVPVLADVMTTLINSGTGDPTVDVAQLRFIDAAGLGCLVGFANQLTHSGSALHVVGASPRLRRVFDIVQLGGLLTAS